MTREAATGSRAEIVARVAALEDERHPRWVWWSAAGTAAPLVRGGDPDRPLLGRPARCTGCVRGGWHTDPTLAWAAAHGGSTRRALPRHAGGDLFDFAGGAADGDAGDPDSPVRRDGYLRPEAVDGGWLTDARSGARRGRPLALETATLQQQALADLAPPRVARTAHSESAAALLCVELEQEGLPIDRADAGAADPRRRRAPAAGRGPRPARSGASATPPCCAHAPGRESTDLRNPVQVRELLASVGVVVPDTRAWRLEPFRGTHPLVEALLDLAQGGADRHDLRLGVAGRPRRGGRPAARRVDAPATARPGG